MNRALLAMLLGLSTACGAAAPASDGPTSLAPEDPVGEIDDLSDEIERIETRAGAVAPVACYRRELAMVDPGCDAGRAVCSRARQICDHAESLGENPWAAERCNAARDTCEQRRCHCIKAAASPVEL